MRDGFLGGTFDPPHFGHLNLAQEALEKFSLDNVYFVPSRNPPHKNTSSLTPFKYRYEMLQHAIEGNQSFHVADLDSVDFPSYTVDMLSRIVSKNYKPCFIMGADSLKEIHTWREPEKILQLADVLVGTRPGFDLSSVQNEYLNKVNLFDFPGVWISSTDIKQRVRMGRSISYLVPEAVKLYIWKRGLYGAAESN